MTSDSLLANDLEDLKIYPIADSTIMDIDTDVLIDIYNIAKSDGLGDL